MRAVINVGRVEGFVNTYNLFFDNGLRLKTESLTWLTADQRAAVKAQFIEVLGTLQQAGVQIEGDVDQ